MINLLNKYRVTTENKLSNDNFLNEINTFYSSGIDGVLDGRLGIKLYYKYFPQPNLATNNNAILIVTGRTEFVLKYKETIFDLYQNGYSVYIIDHRGQGFSERIFKYDCELGYVDSFHFYIDDLKLFFESIIKPKSHHKIYLLGHSLGAAIALRYIQQFPNDFISAAFVSPMLGFNFPICTIIRLFKLDSNHYAFGKANYTKSLQTFSENTITNSELRYKMLLKLIEENPMVKLGGPSYKWVFEACKSLRLIIKDFAKINIPLKLFIGSEEEIVSLKAYHNFIRLLKINKNIFESEIIIGAKHELLLEKDSFRIPVIKNILHYFQDDLHEVT